MPESFGIDEHSDCELRRARVTSLRSARAASRRLPRCVERHAIRTAATRPWR